CRQAIQDLDTALDDPVICCKTESKMSIAPTKSIARNCKQIVLNGLGYKLASRAPRRLGKGIKGAARGNQLETSAQTLDNHIPLASISRHQVCGIIVQGGNASVLHHAGRANIGKLLEFSHFLDEPPGAMCIA